MRKAKALPPKTVSLGEVTRREPERRSVGLDYMATIRQFGSRDARQYGPAPHASKPWVQYRSVPRYRAGYKWRQHFDSRHRSRQISNYYAPGQKHEAPQLEPQHGGQGEV